MNVSSMTGKTVLGLLSLHTPYLFMIPFLLEIQALKAEKFLHTLASMPISYLETEEPAMKRSHIYHRMIPFMLLFALLANLLAVKTTSAADEYTVPKSLVDESVYMIRWNEVHQGNVRVKALMDALIITTMYEQTPGISSNKVIEQLTAFRNEYDRRVLSAESRAYEDSISAQEAIAWSLNVASDSSTTLKNLSTAIVKKLEDLDFDFWNTRNRFSGYEVVDDEWRTSQQLEADLLSYAHTKATKESNFAALWDTAFVAETGNSIVSSAKEIIQTNPNVSVPPTIKQKIENSSTGSISVSTLEMQNEFSVQIDILQDNIDGTLALSLSLDQLQTNIIQYSKDPEKKDQAKELKKLADEYKAVVDAGDAAIKMISKLVELKDPKLGKEISTAGSAFVQVARSGAEFAKAIADFSEKGDKLILACSSVVFAGNLLGGVMAVASLFGDGSTPSSLDPQILENVKQLRAQVDKMYTEMHARFQRIDAKLDLVFNSINLLLTDVVNLGKRVEEIQRELLDIEADLHEFENNTLEFFQDGLRYQLKVQMDEALGYEKHYGSHIPIDKYNQAEAVFYTWATDTSFNAIEAGASQRSYADDEVWEELAGKPLDYNVNYLDGWLINKGVTSFTPKRLPNYRTWAMASMSYARLATEWPTYAAKINSSRLEQVNRVGETFETAIKNIAANNHIFDKLINYYRDKYTNLDNEIVNVENEYKNETNLSSKAIDPWGGVYQKPKLPPDFFTAIVRADGQADPILSAPDHPENYVPTPFLLASVLDLPTVRLLYTADWVDELTICIPPKCYTHAKLQITFMFSDRVWGTIFSRSIKGGDYDITDGLDPYDVLQHAPWVWNNGFKTSFENSLSANPPCSSPTCGGSLGSAIRHTSDQVQTLLNDHKTQIYHRVLDRLSMASQVQTRAKELYGATALLDAFITLGLPHALSVDDFLRALINGNQRIIDPDLVQGAYETALSAEPSDVNVRLTARGIADERINALDEVLKSYVAQSGELQEAQVTYTQRQPIVDSTLLMVRLARILVYQTNNRLFMPLITR